MKRDKLKREIVCELDQLRRVAELSSKLSQVPADRRDPWDAAAAAKFVADLFLGLENLCKRRYKHLDLIPPGGSDHHYKILNEFLSLPELGGSLPEEMGERLKKYLSFRHRFFHGYGYEVSWDIVEEPLRLLPETVQIISNIWTSWLDTAKDK